MEDRLRAESAANCRYFLRALRDALWLRDVATARATMQDGQIHWDVANTLEQLGGDEALLQEVMEIFLREAPQHLEALSLAVQQGNAAHVETMAHTMKGELGYLGVPEISRRARELEEMGHSGDLAGAANAFRSFETEISSLFRSVRDSAASGYAPPAAASPAKA
jgi:HPt (histidine-containing phosphotransfer) domain-containing protein